MLGLFRRGSSPLIHHLLLRQRNITITIIIIIVTIVTITIIVINSSAYCPHCPLCSLFLTTSCPPLTSRTNHPCVVSFLRLPRSQRTGQAQRTQDSCFAERARRDRTKVHDLPDQDESFPNLQTTHTETEQHKQRSSFLTRRFLLESPFLLAPSSCWIALVYVAFESPFRPLFHIFFPFCFVRFLFTCQSSPPRRVSLLPFPTVAAPFADSFLRGLSAVHCSVARLVAMAYVTSRLGSNT
jgi:hypothetical protein